MRIDFSLIPHLPSLTENLYRTQWILIIQERTTFWQKRYRSHIHHKNFLSMTQTISKNLRICFSNEAIYLYKDKWTQESTNIKRNVLKQSRITITWTKNSNHVSHNMIVRLDTHTGTVTCLKFGSKILNWMISKTRKHFYVIQMHNVIQSKF